MPWINECDVSVRWNCIKRKGFVDLLGKRFIRLALEL